MANPSKRKFYVTTLTVVILSEQSLDEGMSLSDLDYAITDGDCSGQFGPTVEREVDGPEMAKLLQQQGSDPEFFRLTENGEDTEDEDDE